MLMIHVLEDSLYLRANAFMTLFCMVSTLFRADMSPERRLEGEGEATVTDSPPREAPGESCVCVCVCVLEEKSGLQYTFPGTAYIHVCGESLDLFPDLSTTALVALLPVRVMCTASNTVV